MSLSQGEESTQSLVSVWFRFKQPTRRLLSKSYRHGDSGSTWLADSYSEGFSLTIMCMEVLVGLYELASPQLGME